MHNNKVYAFKRFTFRAIYVIINTLKFLLNRLSFIISILNFAYMHLVRLCCTNIIVIKYKIKKTLKTGRSLEARIQEN